MTDVPNTIARERVRTQGHIWLVIAGAILLGAFWLKSQALINHDTAWFLYATARWLDGAVLYRDIVEVNPPLAFYLTAPAILLAQKFGIGETMAMTGWILGLAAISLVAAGQLLRLLPQIGNAERGPLLAAGAFAAALLPGAMFAQREHFLIIFLLPYLVLAACRYSGVALSNFAAVPLGAFAAVGLCLKPHFLLIPASIELLLAIRHWSLRFWLRAENIVIASLGAAYIIWAVIAYPEFFSNVLPWGAEAYVPFYGREFSQVELSALPVLAIAMVLAHTAWKEEGDGITVIFITAAFAALAAYLLQAKGYLYQLMPATAFCFLAAARLVIARLDRRGTLPTIPTLAALYFVAEAATGQAYQYDLPDLTMAVERSGARSVFLAGVNVSASFPMVNELGLKWSSRFPAQWLLPYVAHEQASGKPMSERAQATAAYALKSAVDDLLADPPDVIVVDERKTKDYFRGPFDYISFYKQDPGFEIFWRGYQLTDHAGSFAIYTRIEP